MSRKRNSSMVEETPHDMMKRVFAVAELIVRTDGYHLEADTSAEHPKTHKPANILYRIDQYGNSGRIDATEEA